ncbi:MAG TPA: RNA polymerase sigma factor [Streptosporangiaceae bacterium]|jgi:RNA polymerase sigma-70 factor (ECF subfamily)
MTTEEIRAGDRAAEDARERVLSALAADLDAGFAELYAAYRTVVFSTALRVSGRRPDAEDLTAEAFLRAYRALTGYDRERIAGLAPRAWLLTILLNVWRNDRRTVARRPASSPLEAAPDPADPAEPVERTAERHETGRELAGLLALLPEDQRIAIVLRHVDDLPVAEIAQILGCPVGTAKSHISRGLRRLRELHATTASSEVPDE